MIIDFFNIEDLFFLNKNFEFINKKYFLIFEEWARNKSCGDLNNIKKLKISLLNSIDSNDILELEKHYKEKVIVKKIENKIIKNFDSIDNFSFTSYSGYCLFKNKDNVSLTCWR
jgi:uncharacterized protein YktA (UPF0223 family)